MERQLINAQHVNADKPESACIIGLLGVMVGSVKRVVEKATAGRNPFFFWTKF
jgi:hypothetical protein